MQTCVRMVSIRAMVISGLKESFGSLTGEVEAKDLELITIPGLVQKATEPCKQIVHQQEAAANNVVYVTLIEDVLEEAVKWKKAVPD